MVRGLSAASSDFDQDFYNPYRRQRRRRNRECRRSRAGDASAVDVYCGRQVPPTRTARIEIPSN
jgi:hypothetical protein